MNKLRQRPDESITQWQKRINKRHKMNELKRFMRRTNWLKLFTWWGILVITYLIWSNVYSCMV